MRLTFLFLLFLGLVSAAPQGLLSDLASRLGLGGDDTKSTSSAKTLVPAATASITSSKASSTSASRLIGTPVLASSTITTRRSTRTTAEPTTTDSDSESSTPTPTPTTTDPPTAPLITSVPTPTAAPSQSSQSASIPAGGIAVAVIMSIAILAAIAWLIFRYHPGVRKWWMARQDKKWQERSYRAAIDGPFSRGGNGVRTEALSTPNPNSRKSMLQSFFAPRTVHLGGGKEIRRKPVNWGAGAHSTTPELPGNGMEKVALTDMAAPMARSESTVSRMSSNGGWSTMSSPAVPPQELPSPLMLPLPATPDAARTNYAVPPVPPVPVDAHKRGVHQILTRKSIYELA